MNPVYVLDIAHPPLSGADAERVLSESLRKVHSSTHSRILKIIHGYGSGGKGGTLKITVLNWAYVNRTKIKLTLDGMHINPFDASVQRLCTECHLIASKDLGEPNNGVTIIWVK